MNDYSTIAGAISDLSDCVDTAERNLSRTRRARRAAWKSPTLINSWTAYGASPTYEQPGYALDNDGYVHLKGLVKGGASGTPIFNLPTAYRPISQPHAMPTISSSNASCYIQVNQDGNVVAYNGGSGSVTTWVSLAGLSFRIESWGDGEISCSPRVGDRFFGAALDPVWLPPSTREDLSGMVNFTGLVRMYNSITATGQIFTVSHHHANAYQTLMMAHSSNGTTGNLTRIDVSYANVEWSSGINPTNWMLMDGLKWPTIRTASKQSASVTLSSGVTLYSTAQSFPPKVIMVKDGMGRCYVGGLVNITNVTNGSPVLVLPVGYRPSSRLIIPGNNNGTPIPLNIYNDGTMSLNWAGTATWLSFSHCFWLDNG
jgi:hypothetical protein